MLLCNRINRKELKMRMAQSDEKRITISFYRYFAIQKPEVYRNELFKTLSNFGVYGRIYVAAEGINAQISVPETQFEGFKNWLDASNNLTNLRLNIAVEDDGKSFFALTIKVRPKIVADGIDDPDFDPSNCGEHLNAERFNEIAENPETVIVDMRNHYESEVGHFKNAICPDVTTFRESLPDIADMLKGKENAQILMYCTGGIRCEKASAYMKYRGFNKVAQLDGGIIEYARQVQQKGLENKFVGKNFVFDERLGERISSDIISNCHQCGQPCDTHVNCANDHCHLLFIQCENCKNAYESTCSVKCRDFNRLPPEERKTVGKTMRFNGSIFGKGIYRANKGIINV